MHSKAMQLAVRGSPRAAPSMGACPAQLMPRRRCMAAFAVQPAEYVAAAPEAAPVLRAGREAAGSEPPEHVELPAEHAARNVALVARLRGKLILAPLTRGGNVPFRRLCADFGAEARAAFLGLLLGTESLTGWHFEPLATMSEMAFARFLIRDHPQERARLRRADNEHLYGLQFATNNIGEGVRAAELAAASGAAWVDLNCGCPIYEATKRGLGAALLRSPRKLARLVAGIAAGSPLPLTVKVRTGTCANKINVAETVAALHAAGAAAVTVHGRTAEQRYKRPADWGAVAAVAAAGSGPVIGNGDLLTFYEARRRLEQNGCLAVMAGRGALIKPWLFQEYAEGRSFEPDAHERVGIYRRLVAHMKEYFGDDARGRGKAFYFLPWHFDFLTRYRPLPEAEFGADALERPPIGRRAAAREDGLPLLERMLRCGSKDAHAAIAAVLWDAASDAEAANQLEGLADSCLAGWEAAEGGDRAEEEEAVAEG